MPQVACKICSKEFYGKPYFLKMGHAKYCSEKCMRLGSRTGKVVKCHVCGKETYKTEKALRASKSKNYFCTKSCQTKWRNSLFIGPLHANWKNGMYSYQSAMVRYGMPKYCRICKTKDHRILAIHHIDRDRKNNTKTNLAWLCHNCHFLLHHDKNTEDRFLKSI
jgi:hypothetical protein